MPAIEPLLCPSDTDLLRSALAPFTVDGVDELLGPIGRAAHARGDLAGVTRALRPGEGRAERATTLIRLFLLGATLPARDVRDALDPLPLDAAMVAGIVEVDGDEVRAALEIRPYAQDASPEAWWVVSDLGSDVRSGPLAPDHVLGIGNAALTLAQATPRRPVGSALDVGTGCGVQALHLSAHAGRVTATDISERALRFAATTAALSGVEWTLRQGWFLEPAAGETFDLVVANPPFVISPGDGGYDYRDSGLAGDAVCRELVRGLPSVLAENGTAQLLANWIVPRDGSWRDRVAEWFAGNRCDAWVWQRDLADLGEYASLWLRDAGLEPGTDVWRERYDAWLDWFEANDVAAIGMGLITMRDGGFADDDDHAGDVVFDDVPQAVQQPVGGEIEAWFARRRWASVRRELLDATYRAAPDLVLSRGDLLVTDGGWTTSRSTLRQSHGMRWEIEVDEVVPRIVAACDAGATPMLALEMLAAASGDDATRLAREFAPVLRDLVQRGVLLPAELS